LEPTVLAVWNTKQAELFAQCRASGISLIIGGDGRVIALGIQQNMAHTESKLYI